MLPMSARRKKTVYHGKDASQDAIVEALKTAGATVEDLSRAGKGGLPDLLVGFRKKNYMIECKPATGSAKQLRLRDTQEKWHGEWQGQVAIAHTPEDALRIINAQ
jgi:hypothetical protein